MMPLVVLVLTLCRFGDCHEEHVRLDGLTMQACVVHGPIIVAQLLLDRPDEVIVGWRCVLAG